MAASDLRRQHGVAFILVLWLLALLAILLGSFTLLARSDRLQARHHFDTTRARYAAEAGIALAVQALSLPDQSQRWLPDGRAYKTEYGDAELEIRVVDETGKLDLNAADVGTLAAFFASQGLDQPAADQLAAAIVDWRDPDDLVMPNGAEADDYDAAGRDYGPTNAPFTMVAEVQQVLGMNYDLYARVAPYLTVLTGQSLPNMTFAQAPVLAILPGLDPAMAQQIIDMREAWDPTRGGTPPLLPNGSPAVASGGSGTYSIGARATLPNGARTELDVTVRLGGGAPSGLAYTVLRWQDGAMP